MRVKDSKCVDNTEMSKKKKTIKRMWFPASILVFDDPEVRKARPCDPEGCDMSWRVMDLVWSCCSCVRARPLKWCVIIRVHDRKPVFTEGDTVHPSEVAHELVGKEKRF